MKKFLLFFASLFMNLMIANAAIVNLDVEVEGTNASIYWQTDTAVSTWYDLTLYTSAPQAFVEGGWDVANFEIPGTNWLGMTSDLLLQYGMNYEIIGNYGADSLTVAAWETAWNTSVDTLENAYTLKAGVYLIIIAGYDDNNQNVEPMVYQVFTIDEKAEANELIQVRNGAVKFIDRNQFIIKNGESFYDVLGRKL